MKQNYAIKLFIAFKMAYSCCFGLRGNLDFRDFFMQKKFYNINYWLRYFLLHHRRPVVQILSDSHAKIFDAWQSWLWRSWLCGRFRYPRTRVLIQSSATFLSVYVANYLAKRRKEKEAGNRLLKKISTLLKKGKLGVNRCSQNWRLLVWWYLLCIDNHLCSI